MKDYYYNVGYDTIKFYRPLSTEEKQLLHSTIYGKPNVDPHIAATRKHYRGMYVQIVSETLIVHVSVASFMNKHNVQGLHIREVPSMIKALEEVLKLDLKKVRLNRVDVAVDLETDYPVFSYINTIAAFGTKGYTRHWNSGGLTLNNGMHDYVLYSKNTEVGSMQSRVVTSRDGTKYNRRDTSMAALQDLGNRQLLRIEMRATGKMLKSGYSNGKGINIEELAKPELLWFLLRRMSDDLEKVTYKNLRTEDPGLVIVSGMKEYKDYALRYLLEKEGLSGCLQLLLRSKQHGALEPGTYKKMRASLRRVAEKMPEVEQDLAAELSTKIATTIGEEIEALKEAFVAAPSTVIKYYAPDKDANPRPEVELTEEDCRLFEESHDCTKETDEIEYGQEDCFDTDPDTDEFQDDEDDDFYDEDQLYRSEIPLRSTDHNSGYIRPMELYRQMQEEAYAEYEMSLDEFRRSYKPEDAIP